MQIIAYSRQTHTKLYVLTMRQSDLSASATLRFHRHLLFASTPSDR